MPTASLTLLMRHGGHEGGRESRPCLVSCPVLGGDFVLWVFWFFFTKIKMEELIWKRCWVILVVDAYKFWEGAGKGCSERFQVPGVGKSSSGVTQQH